MGICTCPKLDKKAFEELSGRFLAALSPGTGTGIDWCLLNLSELYQAGNSLEELRQTVPFRSDECTRSRMCCGMCTRQCNHRCVQDCLHRLFMWRKYAENASATEQVPLNIRMILSQRFESYEDLSWAVGDILATKTNTKLKEYMQNAELYGYQNPYKVDYAPQNAVDPKTGKRLVNPSTGELYFLSWPKTGLCPYCMPVVTIDRRYGSARTTPKTKSKRVKRDEP